MRRSSATLQLGEGPVSHCLFLTGPAYKGASLFALNLLDFLLLLSRYSMTAIASGGKPGDGSVVDQLISGRGISRENGNCCKVCILQKQSWLRRHCLVWVIK